MKDMISIIVPVYNTEKFLRNCVNSLINQTYNKLEIILVDDGSKDKSGEICDEFEKKDNRITVIHKENGGVSTARNIGIEKSSGEYLMFIDGDDIIDPDMVEFLYNNLVKYDADVSRCGMVRETGDFKEPWGDDNSSAVLRNNLEGVCDVCEANGILPVSPCNKIYKREVIGKIRFDKRFKYAEDTLFNYYVAKKAKKTVCCDKIKYHYISNNESASHKSFNLSKLDEHKVMDIIIEAERDNPKTYLFAIKGDVLKSFRTLKEIVVDNVYKEYYNEIKERILKNKKLILKSNIFSKITKFRVILLSVSPMLYNYIVAKRHR